MDEKAFDVSLADDKKDRHLVAAVLTLASCVSQDPAKVKALYEAYLSPSKSSFDTWEKLGGA